MGAARLRLHAPCDPHFEPFFKKICLNFSDWESLGACVGWGAALPRLLLKSYLNHTAFSYLVIPTDDKNGFCCWGGGSLFPFCPFFLLFLFSIVHILPFLLFFPLSSFFFFFPNFHQISISIFPNFHTFLLKL